MSRKGGVSTVVLIILLITGFLTAGIYFYFYQKEKEKVNSLKESLNEAETKLRLTENKLEDAKKQIALFEDKLQRANNQMEILTRELEKEKSYKDELLKNLEELRTALGEKENNQKVLEENLARAQKEIDRLNAKISNLQEERKELEKKIAELEDKINEQETAQQKVELGEIVVSQQNATNQTEVNPQGKEKRPPLEGKVLVVNKDYSFVVINLGKNQGVRLNDEFSVYHNEKYIGDIRVEKLHDSMSAAGIVSPQLKDKIAEGDRVVRKR